MRTSKPTWLIPLIIAAVAQSPAHGKEGFGLMRKVVALERVSPPDVVVTGIRINVVTKAHDQRDEAIASHLQSQLTSQLIQGDPRLTLDAMSPQTVLELKVLQNEMERHSEQRTESVMQQTGTESDGKPHFEPRQTAVRYEVVTHKLSVAYVVNDTVARRTRYATNADVHYRNDFREGAGAPTQGELEGQSVTQVVDAVAVKLTPTVEVVNVLVPKGSLEALLNFAEAGLWSRYSEALEARTPKSNPVEESYRLYALGLAYEAMAYGADDLETTLRYLEKSAENYNAAINDNPKEDYFFKPYETNFFVAMSKSVARTVTRSAAPVSKMAPPPLERVQQALRQYQTLVSQREVQAAAAAQSATPAADDARREAEAATMKNADVIDMVKANVPEDIVLGAITDAARCAFDITPKGLIELTKAKVGKVIIKKMQERNCGS